ncbi:MAG: hypothetical protein OEM82_04710 [Acidobacteriota bacterium]|nr:hypothetical protein [Acidobacteriota bacterium]MDH3529235.1 hypothetical protein [Acidobacteriota bacterium]
MAKHIIGMILFSLIVGMSLFVAGVTNHSTSVDVSETYRLGHAKKKRKRKRRKRCHPHRRSFEVTLNQVTFNRNSQMLSASLAPSELEDGIVQLHFFAQDSYGTRFLKTEYLEFAGEGIESSKPTPWLSRIDSEQNIYVMAVVSRTGRSWSVQPEFDPYRSTRLVIAGR